MKKLIIKICTIAMCIVPLLYLSSCNDGSTSISSSSSSVVEEKSPITELRIAIKKNPTEYINKQVSLKGTILKEDGKTFLLDYKPTSNGTGNVTGESLRYSLEERYQARSKPKIEVILSDNIQSYVVESWDYVELTGAVKISNEEIYLGNCQCTILIANEE